NLVGRNFRLLHGEGDRARWLFRGIAHAYTVEGFTSGGVARNLRVHAGAASFRVLIIFQHEHPGTFREHEAIAIGREGARRTLRLIVPGLSEGAQQRISLNDTGSNGSVNAACEEHGLHTRLDVLVRETNGIAR